MNIEEERTVRYSLWLYDEELLTFSMEDGELTVVPGTSVML